MAGPLIAGVPLVAGIIGRYLLKYGIKKAIKKYGKTAVNKAKTKIKVTKTTKNAALEGRKVSTDFGKALDYSYKTALRGRKISTKGIKKVSTKGIKKAIEYSPSFMLRNLIRDSLSATVKRSPSKKILKKVITGGSIFASGALTGTAYEKGKKYKKSKKKSKKRGYKGL